MAPELVQFDDPLDPRGWVLEPARRRLAVAFPSLSWTVRAVGMVESWDAYDGGEIDGGRPGMAAACARMSEQYGMPIDEFLWFDDPPTSSWPACRAIAAAGLLGGEDGVDGDEAARRVLRACREATFARRRPISDPAVLDDVLAAVPGVDADAVRTAIGDGRADDAFEAARSAAAGLDAPGVARSGDRCELPTLLVRDGDDARGVSGIASFSDYRAAVEAVTGVEPSDAEPGVEAVLQRFSPEGWVARAELTQLTGLELGAVEERARRLVESDEVVEATFAAEPFWRLEPYVLDGEDADR